MNTETSTGTYATGPKTVEGKRIAARNATSHGLFARDVVLPHLGEDPAGYKALLDALTGQLQPHNLLEQHYVEKIAAASWRLRRLQRWQAQLFEDPDITEDQALDKLDRVMRHETNLHRQIDTSVKMLARDLPKLFHDRVRADLIRDMNGSEQECREDPYMNEWIVAETKRRLRRPGDPGRRTRRPTKLSKRTPPPSDSPRIGGRGASSPVIGGGGADSPVIGGRGVFPLPLLGGAGGEVSGAGGVVSCAVRVFRPPDGLGEAD